MEGARPPLLGDELELSEVQRRPDERTPLNGAVQIIPFPAEEPSPAQAKQKNPWSSCNRKLFGRCKLWMAILSIFIGLIIMITISLCLMKVTYIDEDENEILELSSNKTFLVTLKIPEECVTEEELPLLLQKRVDMVNFHFNAEEHRRQRVFRRINGYMAVGVRETVIPGSWLGGPTGECGVIYGVGNSGECTLCEIRLVDVYSSSPSLSRYFTSVETNFSLPFGGENATITYHLQFGVPSEDKNFMKYMMSEELVLGILLQDFHDQNLSACETLELDPESLLLYE